VDGSGNPYSYHLPGEKRSFRRTLATRLASAQDDMEKLRWEMKVVGVR
jgi:hypothetical protein